MTALRNGNYVVSSPGWQNNGIAVGAATWVNGSTGQTIDGAISIDAVNSLIGSTNGDQVSSGGVTALSNGNYVVSSPFWQNGGAQVGAVTWSNGFIGTAGAVSSANSLVGSNNFDDVGSDGVTALSNGNYVVSSSFWHIPLGGYGAVTWGNGSGGTVGPVSASNSLVNGFSSGEVGPGVTALSNGNYVVSSPYWTDGITLPDGNIPSVGAVTWCKGTGGTVGSVSSNNSLIGSTSSNQDDQGDQISSGGVKALTNGNYVVSSPNWQNGSAVVGAATWCSGGGATVGSVSITNSLVGSTNGDQVGSGGVTALTNGNYVVLSPNWQSGSAIVGAATWSNGTTGQTRNGAFEAVSAANSLFGQTNGDQVSSGGVTALSNGNYVVSSPGWQNGAAVVGAATWGKGDGSTVWSRLHQQQPVRSDQR